MAFQRASHPRMVMLGGLRFEPAAPGTYPVTAEDRWMPSPVTAEGSGRDREIPVPGIPRR
jgi:hypothetical protein